MEDINQTLDKAIQAKDVQEIRDVLTTSMVQDPGFSKGVFEERLKRCLSAGISESVLFVPFEGEKLNNDQAAWDKDYYATQRTEFRYNFSLERLEQLKKIGRKLFPSASAFPQKEEAKRKYGDGGTYRREQNFNMEKDGFPKWLIPVGIGVAAVAILLFVLFG
jgi:hypothetical protein